MSLLIAGVVIVAAVAIGIAFYKHHTASAVAASAKKEIAYLETFVANVDSKVKVEYAATVKRLKAIF